ncbi:MAG: hypothetical protein M3680_23185 [Myxococcota bacterium]|nr:hypothetical protein [Myxococcota bacterium]
MSESKAPAPGTRPRTISRQPALRDVPAELDGIEEHTAIRSADELDALLATTRQNPDTSFEAEEHTVLLKCSQELAAVSMELDDPTAPDVPRPTRANVVARARETLTPIAAVAASPQLPVIADATPGHGERLAHGSLSSLTPPAPPVDPEIDFGSGSVPPGRDEPDPLDAPLGRPPVSTFPIAPRATQRRLLVLAAIAVVGIVLGGSALYGRASRAQQHAEAQATAANREATAARAAEARAVRELEAFKDDDARRIKAETLRLTSDIQLTIPGKLSRAELERANLELQTANARLQALLAHEQRQRVATTPAR